MSKYDRSTHRNDKAAKNRITDNRHEREDNEQAAYLSQWAFDHPKADSTCYILLILVGIVAAFSVVTYTRMHRAAVVSMASCPIVGRVRCGFCHVPEVIKYPTLDKYKAGATYRFEPVTRAQYAGLMLAESKGKYLNEMGIRGVKI